MTIRHTWVVGLIFGLALAGYARAETISASGVSRDAVVSAISSAVSGDVVDVPAGRARWSSNITIPDNKRITVQGAGPESTVIEGGGAFTLGLSGSRITGFGFTSSGADFISVSGTGWRVDHCRFENTGSSSARGVWATSYSYDPPPAGLVDHCEFIYAKVLSGGSRDLTGAHIWVEPLGLGTDNAVFIEDCTFRYTGFGNCVDSNYGGRYVFRYNTVIDAYVEAHSAQGGQEERGTRSWEIYENTFEAVNQAIYFPFRIRGGTGVVFNNTITGRYSDQHIGLDNVRSCWASGGCDGTNVKDGNTSGIEGYPCRDQIGRSTDEFLYRGDGNWPPQELDPAYAWGNTNDSGTAEFVSIQCSRSQQHVQEGRDFINGTVRPGYTPFEYPHPMIAEGPHGADESVEPPSGIRVE